MLLSAVLRGAHDTAAQADALPEAFALAALTVSKVAASPSAQAPQAGWVTWTARAAVGQRSQHAHSGRGAYPWCAVFEARLPELSAAGQSAPELLMHARQAPSLRETQLVLA